MKDDVLTKIQQTTSCLQKLSKAKFVASGSNHSHMLKAEGFDYMEFAEAQLLAMELNLAIKPVIAKFEKELRRQIAICAKE